MAYVKIRPRRGMASQWEYANPILSEGEMAFEVPDTGVGTGNINIKQGDGQTAWNNLPYAFNGATLNEKVDTLSNTVYSYSGRISTLEQKVDTIEDIVGDIRRIDIQKANIASPIVGQIWIDADIVNGYMTISPSSSSIVAGDRITLALSRHGDLLSNLVTVRWTSSNDNVVSLSNQTADGCTVFGIMEHPNNITITATAILNGAIVYTAYASVKVGASGTISLEPSSATVIINSKTTFNIVTSPTLIFTRIDSTSSLPNYATITQNAPDHVEVQGLQPGTSMIYTRAFNEVSGREVLVAETSGLVTIGGVKWQQESYTLPVNSIQNLIFTIYNMTYGVDYNTITVDSTNESIIEVTSTVINSDHINGTSTVNCKTAGTCELVLRVWRDGSENAIQVLNLLVVVSGTITVINPASKILKLVAQPGSQGTIEISNSIDPSLYDEVVWTIDDDEIASIETAGVTPTSGIIRPRYPGATTVTITAYNHATYVDNDICRVEVEGTIVLQEQGTIIDIIRGNNTTLHLINTLTSDYTIEWTKSPGDSTAIDIGSKTFTPDGEERTIIGVNAGSARVIIKAIDNVTGIVAVEQYCDIVVTES